MSGKHPRPPAEGIFKKFVSHFETTQFFVDAEITDKRASDDGEPRGRK